MANVMTWHYDSFVEDMWIPSEANSNFDIPTDDMDMFRCALALCEESGEFAGKFKKLLRGDPGLDTDALLAELGDLQFYVSMMAQLLDSDTGSVMLQNMEKLSKRKDAGTIKGSGDYR